MASGTIYGTTSNQYIDCKIEWSSVADTANNKSTVTASLYYKRNNTGYTTYGSGSFQIIINNQNVGSTSVTLTIKDDAWVHAATKSLTVSHDTEGKKSVKIKATGYISGTSLEATYCEGTATLDTIPRATTLSSVSCPSGVFSGSIYYYVGVSGSASGKYHRLKVYFVQGSTSTQVKSIDVGIVDPLNPASFSLSESELSTIYNKLPNETSGTLRIWLETFANSNYTGKIGSSSSKEITLNIPNDATTQPTVESMSLSASNSLQSPYNSLYIQGFSKVKASLSFGTKYGATVVASSITVNDKSYASPYESDILTQSGTITVKATVKDSRGHYGTNYKDIEVIPYSKPYVAAKSGETSIICARCDASASFTNDDTSKLTYLKIKAKIVYSDILQKNHGYIKYRYRKEGTAYPDEWTTILDCKEQNSDEVITGPLLNGALKTDENYQVQIIASDDLFDSDPITFAIPSDKVYMDRPAGGRSMGLGGYVPTKDVLNDVLDIYWKTRARGGLSLVDTKGDEIPLNTTLPIPRDQVQSGFDADNLQSGVYVVTDKVGLKSGSTTIMANGVLIQMGGTVGDGVKIQLTLPVDSNRVPMFRVKWYNNWSSWRSMKDL